MGGQGSSSSGETARRRYEKRSTSALSTASTMSNGPSWPSSSMPVPASLLWLRPDMGPAGCTRIPFSFHLMRVREQWSSSDCKSGKQ